MPRVKRGTIHIKKRRTLKKAVKGYKWGRKNKIKLARPAMLKAGVYAYRDRRNKKRARRALWQIQIAAACKERGTSYSKLIGLLKKANIEIDRKILATLAKDHTAVFDKILEKAGATAQ
ncbi:50S ribosomal protein L20 [Candidatus Uhrbacteria bacterium]|nr:50S ribosomal protein L20 [Candidatus Uhrbacteria bacterium]